MAFINCSECGKKIDDKEKTCPECGCPLNEEKDGNKYIKKTISDLFKILSIVKVVLIIALAAAGFMFIAGLVNFLSYPDEDTIALMVLGAVMGIALFISYFIFQANMRWKIYMLKTNYEISIK